MLVAHLALGEKFGYLRSAHRRTLARNGRGLPWWLPHRCSWNLFHIDATGFGIILLHRLYGHKQLEFCEVNLSRLANSSWCKELVYRLWTRAKGACQMAAHLCHLPHLVHLYMPTVCILAVHTFPFPLCMKLRCLTCWTGWTWLKLQRKSARAVIVRSCIPQCTQTKLGS